ncbi:N-acetyl-gamma-glutamyl-phosphate reductase [Candidatus Sulcia muelleri SMDSEM]|uniref:N-acetyl-gamma-glutamyl-phosphate reductase n=1 Tax=Karelsulcia muelleri (strain SMDSEM) TaxID=595499 RepID=C7LK70_KARMS|nr:N-acetyl-gamma-glutamyl-phosphate reductase [Candidatus Karelsulcia muelleri SMDSEM]
MIKIGIIGGAGYTSNELIKILNNHPKVEIKNIVSTTYPGIKIEEIHQNLIGEITKRFSRKITDEIDLLFLCIGHGQSKKILKNICENEKINVIDLSNDFRMNNNSIFKKRRFKYGLPELNKNILKKTKNIANPGCFATAIQLAILPLAKSNLLKKNIHISAITGSTGAGRMNNEKLNFSWRNNNISTYKVLNHSHIMEVKQTINQLQKKYNGKIYLIPYRGCFSRGIISTLYTSIELSFEEIKKLYYNFYKKNPFIFISEKEIHLKQVINTNKCIINLNYFKKKVIITSIIDNLIKGASGQAVQNMNIMYNLKETCGLKLTPLGV